MASRKKNKMAHSHCAPSKWRSQIKLKLPNDLVCYGTEPMCQQSGGQTPDGKASNAFAADIALPAGFRELPRVSAIFHSPKNPQAPPLRLYAVTIQPDLSRCALGATTGGPQVADDYVCVYSIIGSRKKKSATRVKLA